MTYPIVCFGRRVLLMLAIGTSVCPFSQPSAGESSVRPEPEMSVSVQDGLLWGRIHDVPLEEAIRAIGESARFQVKIQGELLETVRISFNGESVVDGVRRLLRKNSWIASYEAAGRIGQLYVWQGGVSTEVDPPGKHPVPETVQSRLKTIKELARERPEGAFEALASALFEDADPVVRRNAAAALVNFPAGPAASALAAVLGDHAEDPNVRRIAAWALGRLDDESAEWALRDAVSDPEPSVQQAAKDALQVKGRP